MQEQSLWTPHQVLGLDAAVLYICILIITSTYSNRSGNQIG